MILLAGMGVAFGISLWRAKAIKAMEQENGPGMSWVKRFTENRPVASRRECLRLLEELRLSRDQFVHFLRDSDHEDELGPQIPAPERMVEASQLLAPEEFRLLTRYRMLLLTAGTIDKEDAEPFAAAAAAEPVSGIIGSMYGDVLQLRGEYEPALAAYDRGAADPEAGADSCRRALDLCRRRGWTSKLQNRYQQPGWREAVLENGAGDYTDNYQAAIVARDWTGVLSIVWDGVWMRVKTPLWVLMAGLCGALWFLVVHMGGCVPVRLWWRGLLGFGCGLLSIPLTHIFIILQESWMGTQEHSEGMEDILYCISGIGLREELAKLVMFVPLLILLRRATAAQVLAVASSVGLGFAILENVTYFEWGEGTAVWARFITANFLHFGLTGMTGLALWQATRNSKWLPHFAWVLVAAVVFHGLWDFSPKDPRIAGDYHDFLLAGLAGLALYYFRELCRYSETKPGVPSAVFVYLAGGALLLSVLLSCLAWDTGFRLALVNTFDPVLQLFAIGAAMFYQLRKG